MSCSRTTIEPEPGCSSSHHDMQKPLHSFQGNDNNVSYSMASTSTTNIMDSTLWKYSLSFLMNFGGKNDTNTSLNDLNSFFFDLPFIRGSTLGNFDPAYVAGSERKLHFS